MLLFCYIARYFSNRRHCVSFTLQLIWGNVIFLSVIARVFTLSFVPRIESCAGLINPRGLRVPAFAGRVREPALLCVRVRVELAAWRGECGLYLVRVRVEKFFVWVTEC